MPARTITLILVSAFFASSPAGAQVQFDLCEGEHPDRCGSIAHTSCYTVDQWAQQRCSQITRGKYIKIQIDSRGGNRCGYTRWKIVCQE